MTDAIPERRLAVLAGVAAGAGTLSNGVIVVSLTRIATSADLTAAALRSALGWASTAALAVVVVWLLVRVGNPGPGWASLTFIAAAAGMVIAASAHGWAPMALGLGLTGPTVPMAARWRRAAMAVCPDGIAFENRASWAAKLTRLAGALIGGPFLVWTGHWWMAAAVVAALLAMIGGLLGLWQPAHMPVSASGECSVRDVLRTARGRATLVSLFCAALVYQYIWSTVEPDLAPGFGRLAPTLASAGVVLHLLSGMPARAAAKHAGVAPRPAMRRASWGVVSAAAANTSAIALAIAGVTDRWMVLGEAGIRIGLAEAGYNMVQSAGRVAINRLGTAAALLSALAMAAGTAAGSWVGTAPGRLGGIVPHWAARVASVVPHGMRTITFEAAVVLAVSGIAVLAHRRRAIPEIDPELVAGIEPGRGQPRRYTIRFLPARVRGGYGVCRVRFGQRPDLPVSATLEWHCFRLRTTLRAGSSAALPDMLGDAIGWACARLRDAGALDPPAPSAGMEMAESSGLLAHAGALDRNTDPGVVQEVCRALARELGDLNAQLAGHAGERWAQRRRARVVRELRRLSPQESVGDDVAARTAQRPTEQDR